MEHTDEDADDNDDDDDEKETIPHIPHILVKKKFVEGLCLTIYILKIFNHALNNL
jgi:hypothetical protein